jgi:rhomboid protease GluP
MTYNPPPQFPPNPEEPHRPVHPLERRPVPGPYQEPAAPVRPPTPRVSLPSRTPVFTYVLLAIIVVIYLVDSGLLAGRLTLLGMKENTAILRGEYWRLVTPMFLHSLDTPLHLMMNGYSLFIIGPQVERSYGYFRFLAIYFIAGIGGNIASFGMSPNPAVGASGAIFGLIGALLPLLYLNRHIIANTRRSIMSIVQVIVINLVIGLIPGIDNWGHIGGLLTGLTLAALITPRYKVERSFDGTISINDETSFPMILVAISVVSALLAIAFWLFVAYRSLS